MEFLENHAARKPATTLDFYMRALRMFSTTIKVKKLSTVKRITLEVFANARLKEGVASATVNRDLRHVRAAMKWAKRRGMVSEIPDFANVFIKEHRKKPTIIPQADFMAMLGAIRNPDLRLTRRPVDWWRVFLYIAYYLGFRRGEILSLSWDDINFTTFDVRIRASTSKSRKERMVPMPAEMAKVLEEWRAKTDQSSSSDPVLPWPYDTYRQLYADWHRIQKMAGMPEDAHYVPKNCRSTCASELIANQVPTVVVKDFLGHATVATTENYYINTKPAMRAAAQARKVQVEAENTNPRASKTDGSDESKPKM
jgi:integrase